MWVKVIYGSAALLKLQSYLTVNLFGKVYFSIVYCHLHYAIFTWGTAKTKSHANTHKEYAFLL